MSIDEALASFEKLKKNIAANRSASVSAKAELNLVRAVAESWFRTYRPGIAALVGETPLENVDAGTQRLLKLTLARSERSKYRDELVVVIKTLKQGLVVEAKIAEWSRRKETDGGFGDERVVSRLESLQSPLADAYRQVTRDLSDSGRLSYRGPANELREILREVLHSMAPNEEVRKEPWFRKGKGSPPKDQPPTQGERARYIAGKQGLGGSASDTIEEATITAEERLGSMVRALYQRSNAAAHIQRERDEILKILRYVDAVLLELLPD